MDDNRLAILADLFDGGLAAHDHRAAAGHQGGACARPPDDLAACGKVWPGHDIEQRVQRDLGVIDVGQAGVDNFAQVVRRDVGGHTDGDAACAVHQQVRDPRRQDHRLVLGAVVIVLPVDGIVVDVVGQRMGELGATNLGVTHGRGRIAVDRAEIALAVDQQQAHRERLRHTHQGVVDRLVPVRVVLTHHVTDDAGGLDVGAVGRVPLLAHREQDAPVHRLQPVTDVRQRAADDHAHGVIQVRTLQLVFDRDRGDAARPMLRGRCGAVVGQGRETPFESEGLDRCSS